MSDDDQGPQSKDVPHVMVRVDFVWVWDWIMAMFEHHLDSE